MSAAIQKFVDEARAKGFTNDQIVQLLVDGGWPLLQAQAAVIGLQVPRPPHEADAQSANVTSQKHRRSISALEAALQHILLWVFTITSSIMLGVVSAALFNDSSTSSDILLTFVVVELVTFIPFLLLFIQYMRQFRKHPDITTGKIWSIITIVFHSVGLVGALISMLLFMVLVDGSDRGAGVAASIAIAVMNGAVVIAYATANFVKPAHKWRLAVLVSLPMVLFVLIGIFGLIALNRVGPIREDAQTREDLTKTVKEIRKYTKTHKKLPDSTAQIAAPTQNITYTQKSGTQYELCVVLHRDTSDSYYSEGPIQDEYVYESDFEGVESGRQCFLIEAGALLRYNDQTGQYEPITTGTNGGL